MSASVTIDFSKFNQQVERYITELHQSAPEVIRTQARLFLQQAMKFTPPKTKGQGEGAIKGDLFGVNVGGVAKNKAVFVGRKFKPGSKDADLQQGYVGSGGNPLMLKGEVFHDKTFIRPNASHETLKAHHYKQRSRATGRTTRAGSWSKEIGRSRSRELMVAPVAAIDQYLRYTLSKVGRLKAGWVPAIERLGGSVKPWVKRHAASAKGTVQFQLGDKNHPSITIGNFAAGAGKLAHHVKGAMEVRVKSMAKDIRVKLGQAKKIF